MPVSGGCLKNGVATPIWVPLRITSDQSPDHASPTRISPSFLAIALVISRLISEDRGRQADTEHPPSAAIASCSSVVTGIQQFRLLDRLVFASRYTLPGSQHLAIDPDHTSRVRPRIPVALVLDARHPRLSLPSFRKLASLCQRERLRQFRRIQQPAQMREPDLLRADRRYAYRSDVLRSTGGGKNRLPELTKSPCTRSLLICLRAEESSRDPRRNAYPDEAAQQLHDMPMLRQVRIMKAR